MSWESNSITRSSGEDIHFPDPGPGNVVTITLRYNYDASSSSLPSLYCPGCQRQVLFKAGDAYRDCDGYNGGATASEASLTSTYTSDGSTKHMYVAVDLNYGCSSSTKVPNSYIGFIEGTPYPTTATPSVPPTTAAPSINPTTATPTGPSVPPTTSAPSAPSVPPTNAPSVEPTSPPSDAQSDDQGRDSNDLHRNVV
eukprot:392656_1